MAAEEGTEHMEPDILTVVLLEGGTKADGKDIGTGSFSSAQYTKNMALKINKTESDIFLSYHKIHSSWPGFSNIFKK